jgi:L-ascorbate metabolism protein UlaG (beta-lactamase superfamily)
LVPLPFPIEKIVSGLDAIFVTHLHRDHFDDGARTQLPRGVPVFCQPEDEERLRQFGLRANAVNGAVAMGGIQVTRTGGQHGTGQVARALAPVSGFVFDDIYVAGDTIWCDEVADAIDTHRPTVAIVNGSGARFLDSGPIGMTTGDIREVVARVPTVVVVHLEAINHCVDSRDLVRHEVPQALVPEDGETIDLPLPAQ